MSIDALDTAERLDDAADYRAECRHVAEHNADSQNDDAAFEAMDAPIVAYTAKLLTSFDAWARGAK